MDTSSIAIVCIRLASFSLLGHPISVAFRYLQVLFPATHSDKIIFHDLVLDFEDRPDGGDPVFAFQANIQKLLAEMQM
jgi:hypothetical protein